MSSDPYAEIKARLDIVDYIQSCNVPLKRAGAGYKARCPFHNEDTPSFSVNPERQTWHCFGACGEGGDVFDFYKKQNNVGDSEALRALATLTGVKLAPRRGNDKAQKTREKVLGVLSAVADWYRANLSLPIGAGALSYIRKRGITDKTIQEWGFGYAPGGWRSTFEYLTELGYQEDILLAAGVIARNSDKGTVYDVYRNRLIIPITDPDGKIVSFAGRALDPNDTPKYLNGGATAVFSKSTILFGFHHARPAIRESKSVTLFEGYLDVITAHQEGFKNTVGSMGTAFTREHATALGKVADKVVLCFDPDGAGDKATVGALPTLQAVEKARPFDLCVLVLPDARDPDELILQDKKVWEALKPVSAIDHVLKVKAGDVGKLAFSERQNIATELIPIMIGAGTEAQRRENVTRLAEYLKLDPDLLKGEAFSTSGEKIKRRPPVVDRACSVEQDYLTALVARGTIYALTQRKCNALGIGGLKPHDITSPSLRAVFNALLQAWEQVELSDQDYVLENTSDTVFDLYSSLAASPNPFTDDNEAVRSGLRLRKATFERLMNELKADNEQTNLYIRLMRVLGIVTRELQTVRKDCIIQKKGTP